MKSLVVRYGGEVVGSHVVQPGTLTFGRRGGGGPEPDLHFPTSDDFISEQHCHFIVEPDYVEVVDGWPGGRTRSTYGVHVNGIRIDRFEIEEGDVIALGDPADGARHIEITLEESADASTGERLGAEPGIEDITLPRRVWDNQDLPEEVQPAPSIPTTPHVEQVLPPAYPPAQHVSEPTMAVEEEPEPPTPMPGRAPTPPAYDSAAADATEIATREAELEIIRGPAKSVMEDAGIPGDRAAYRGRKFRLHQHQQEAVIGRDFSCDLCVHDADPTVNKRISRQHARIEYRPEEGIFRLYNRGGNGTIVRRLRSPVMDDAILNDRDVIMVGRTALQIRIMGLGEDAGLGQRSKGAQILTAIAVLLLVLGGAAIGWVKLSKRFLPSAAPVLAPLWTQEVDGGARGRVTVGAGWCSGRETPDVIAVSDNGTINGLQGVGGNPIWSDPPRLSGGVLADPLVADVDGDEMDDVIVATGSREGDRGELALINGRSGQVIWSEKPGCLGGSCSYPGQPALVDVDFDGVNEIVVGGADRSGGFVCLVDARSGQERWRYPSDRSEVMGEVRRPVVVAMDGDGVPTIVAAADDGNLYVLEASGTLREKTAFRGWALSALAVGNLDGRNGPDVVVVNDGYQLLSFDIEAGGQEQSWFQMNRDIYGISAAVDERSVATAPVLADLDRDGLDDVIMPHPGWDDAGDVNAVFALRGRDLGEILWTHSLGEGRLVLAPPAAADLDGDGVSDAVVVVSDLKARQAELLLLSGATGDEMARYPLPDAAVGSSAPVLADLYGDGSLDIAIGLEGGRVAAFNLGVGMGSGDEWLISRRDISNSGRAGNAGSALDFWLVVAGYALLGLALVLFIVAIFVRQRAQWALS